MLGKILSLLKAANEKGIYVPLISNHGSGSVSLTILVLSTTTTLLACFHYRDLNFWEALAWNVTSAVLYYNKKAKVSKDGIEIGSDDSGK